MYSCIPIGQRRIESEHSGQIVQKGRILQYRMRSSKIIIVCLLLLGLLATSALGENPAGLGLPADTNLQKEPVAQVKDPNGGSDDGGTFRKFSDSLTTMNIIVVVVIVLLAIFAVGLIIYLVRSE